MAKRIVEIGSERFGAIKLHSGYIFDITTDLKGKTVEAIEFTPGSSDIVPYTESYIVKFVNSTKTLEVFDVNYVIRDEE